VITPIVSGLGNPGGMVFVDTSKHDQDDHRDEDHLDQCRDRDWDSH
jgi:hypothetical protein